MQQALKLKEQLIYSAENFIPHSGVRNVIALCEAAFVLPEFSLTLIYGKERFGKTHLCVYLNELSNQHNLQPLMLSGSDLNTYLQKSSEFPENGLVLIDDIDEYLSQLNPGQSGPLVAFVEHCRVKKIPIIMFSRRNLADFSIDEHLISRLRMGTGVEIQAPKWEEFESLFRKLSEQRGLKLPDRQLEFLNKRLGFSIPEIETYVERLYLLKAQHGKDRAFELMKMALNAN